MSENSTRLEELEERSEFEAGPLRIRDLFLFLLGNRESIVRVVHSPWSLFVGLFFVWTAGIARHYDLHLLHLETKWIWAPFLVAAVTSIFVYLLTFLAILAFSGKRTPNFFAQYASFYGAFLMTAPIAWLYAIPVEFLADSHPLKSAQGNIVLLAIVSLWRVVLMIRVIGVITRAPIWKIVFVVMLPLAVVTFFASAMKSLDIVGIMGGVELTPTQEFKRHAYDVITQVSLVIAAISFIGIWFPIGKEKRGLGFFEWMSQPAPRNTLIAATGILLVWIGLAFPFQKYSDLRNPRQSLEDGANREKSPEVDASNKISKEPQKTQE